jgi:uncharacterized membrane protein YkvI
MRSLILYFALAAEVCVAIAIIHGLSGESKTSAWAAGLWVGGGVFTFLIWMNVVTLIHELGHLVAGLRAGLQFQVIRD